jgi:hypothetical protein
VRPQGSGGARRVGAGAWALAALAALVGPAALLPASVGAQEAGAATRDAAAVRADSLARVEAARERLARAVAALLESGEGVPLPDVHLAVPVGAEAGAPRRSGPEAEVRIGVVASTPLARDAHAGGEVTVRPRPAPVVAVAVGTGITERARLELRAGASAPGLGGSSGAGDWRGPSLTVVHGVVGIRGTAAPGVLVRGGVGAIRYAGSGAGLFAHGPERRALLEAGGGLARRVGAVPLSLELALQTHGFATPAYRAAGGVDGRVTRWLLTGGVVLGGGRREVLR